MKKFRMFCAGAAVAACVVSFTACGGDDENPGDEVVSSEEAKEHLESVAKDYMNKFNRDDQKPVVDLTQHFLASYGQLEAPANWGGSDVWAKNVMKSVNSGAKGDFVSLTRAVGQNLDFSMFAGVYEPGTEAWVKKSDSKDVVFRFKNASNQDCELKAVAEGKTWSSATVYPDGEYTATIPQIITVTLTENGNTLLNGRVDIYPDFAGHTLTADVDVTLTNIRVVAKVNGTDSKIGAHADVYVSGELLTSADATVNGSHLCDANYLSNPRNDLASLVSNGSGTADVLGRLQMSGDVKNIKSLYESDDYFWFDGAAEKTAAEKDCRNYCTLLKNSISTRVYFGGSAEQAHIEYTPVLDSWTYEGNEYGEWYAIPVIAFSDGTTYEFEEYFGSQFSTVEKQMDALLNSYWDLWR